MTTSDRGNVTISGATGPNKPVVVFLSSPGDGQNQWQLLAPTFESDFRVVVLDLPGPGDPAAARRTLGSYANDLLAALQGLALYHVVLVGHSAAALIGVLAAAQEPLRFAKLVLVSPSPRLLSDRDPAGGFEQQDIDELLAALETDRHGRAPALAPVLAGLHESPALVMHLTNSFIQSNPGLVRYFIHITFFANPRAELPFAELPTLIVQSAHHVVAPLAVGYYLLEQLVNSHLAVVDAKGHSPHLSAPYETHAALASFLAVS